MAEPLPRPEDEVARRRLRPSECVGSRRRGHYLITVISGWVASSVWVNT